MIESLYSIYQSSTGVSTDTRTIEEGNIFFALRGPRFDANKMAREALEKGAMLAVIDNPEYDLPHKTLLVEDVLKTLQQLANYHRKQLTIPVIGITGSNGKTTTKELLQAVLSRQYRTFATKGNLNNHIGVPLSLLDIGPDIELAIIEMGANKIGDIRDLSEIAEPTHGMITNIGKAHIEGFGSEEGVLRGKTELYDWLHKHGGTVFINSNDPKLAPMARRFEEPVLFPGKEDFFHCEVVDIYPFVQVRTASASLIRSQLIGAYNFSNIAAGLCFGKYFQVPPEKAAAAIENYVPENNRSQIIQKGTNTIIMDAYNANPNSMMAALENLEALQAMHKTVILGDMFELGDIAETEHRKIGDFTRDKDFEQVIFCGELMRYAAAENPAGLYFEDRKRLLDYLKDHPVSGQTLLIKGSRAMELEKILDILPD